MVIQGNHCALGGGTSMLQKAETIYHKANELVRRCGTRDTLRIASEIGIYIHQIGDFKELLGMYSYQHKERHILLNSNMDYITAQMVCGHEIGHDALHRDQAKIGMGLQEFTLFDMRNEMEYEANAFAAHLRIDSEELLKLAGHGYDVVQLSSIMETNVNLILIKLNELNRMGLQFNLPYIPCSDFLKNVTVYNRSCPLLCRGQLLLSQFLGKTASRLGGLDTNSREFVFF